MVRKLAGGWIAMSTGTLLWVAVASSDDAQAAGIGWESNGPFQACLDARAKRWIDARVELVVSDSPAAGDVDDLAVAKWTIQVIDGCKARAGSGDPASEQLFGRYMAHWREHIDRAAAEIRRRLPPD